MMKKFLFLLAAFLIPMNSGFANDLEEAETFFGTYATMLNGHDQNIAALYSDEAVINTKRKQEDGTVEMINHHPLKWKRIMTLAMQLGKIRKDRTDFRNIQIFDEGDGSYKIKAERYSHLLCYTDKGFYQRVKKSSDGQFLIVEEYLETQATNNC